MAWISVYEQVIGGKLRNTAKQMGCSQNEVLGMLVRLWLWCINNADKKGRIIGADKQDVEEILAIGICKDLLPENAVDVLVLTGWVDIEEDGLYIHDWEEWQKQWYRVLDIREKDAIRKRNERARKRAEASAGMNTGKKENGVQKPILPLPRLVVSDGNTESARTLTYTKDFEEFWAAYPRKVGKGEAYKKYKARLNDGWNPAELKAAAEAYALKVQTEKTEKQYIKHGKTFLSDSTPFADYIPKNIGIEQAKSSSDEDDPMAEWR